MRQKDLSILLVGLLAAIVFIPLLGACPLFDWDEINFAECAREMLVSGDYSHVQLNYRPFWEKPPFFIWLQALSMNIFGVNEFAARFPNAVCSIVSLMSLFYIGTRIHSQRMGFIWVLLYSSALLPHLYFRSGLIDPWFNLFIFLSVYQGIRLLNDPGDKRAGWYGVIGGIFLGLAVLTKGPAALVIVGLTMLIYTVWTRNLNVLLGKGFMLYAVFAIVVACSWFAVEVLRGNGHIIKEFIDYQVRLIQTGDAGHEGPFFYHFVVLLIGCFPASVIFIAALFRRRDLTPYQRLNKKVMLALFWTVLLLFSIVKTKIVHYSSLCYFPLTFVAATALSQDQFPRLRKGITLLYWIVALVIFVLVSALTLFYLFKNSIINSGLIKDEFAVMNLQADVYWGGYEWLLALLFLAGSVMVYKSIKKENRRLLYSGLFTQLVFVWLAIALIIPKVELYSQHAAVAFYKACAQQNCYVETHGFKSYAYVFYSKRQPQDFQNPDQQQHVEKLLDDLEMQGWSKFSAFPLAHLNWIEYGRIDRPAYVVIKTPAEQELLNHSGMKKLYQLNGYSFFVRMPDK